jgi:hypothetical protein
MYDAAKKMFEISFNVPQRFVRGASDLRNRHGSIKQQGDKPFAEHEFLGSMENRQACFLCQMS